MGIVWFLMFMVFIRNLLVFEVLYTTEALEGSIDHDCQPCAQGLTLLHAVRSKNNASTFLNNASQHVPEVTPCGGVHASGGFIQ